MSLDIDVEINKFIDGTKYLKEYKNIALNCVKKQNHRIHP